MALRFTVEQKHFENKGFRKRWHLNNHVVNPNPQRCPQAFPALALAISVLRRSVQGKRLMRIGGENAVFKFLLRSMDETSILVGPSMSSGRYTGEEEAKR